MATPNIDLSSYATTAWTNSNFASTNHIHSANDITSGTLSTNYLSTIPITKGGTNATTATNARTNLGAASINNPTFTGTMSMGRLGSSTVGTNSVVLGSSDNTASKTCSIAMGYNNTVKGQYGFACGNGNNTNSYKNGVAIGEANQISGTNGVAIGVGNKAYHNAYALGWYNTAYDAGSVVIGQYSKQSSGNNVQWAQSNDAFIIGNSANNVVHSNAFRVTFEGRVYGQSSYNSSGADYAEYFEWIDQNPNNEDRVGYFVTLKGKQIQIATPNDYILGIVSGLPCIIGNADEDWLGRWEHDDFGRFTHEYFEQTKEEVSTENMNDDEISALLTNEDYVYIDNKIYHIIRTPVDYPTKHYDFKANPDYDNTQPYIERKDRQEWDAVGMLGVLSIRDDGTCQVDGFCKVAEGGIATHSDEYIIGKTYRVIERVSDNVVKIIFK